MGFYFNSDSLTPSKGSGGGGSIPVIDSLSVTPTTSAQTITTPSGIDGYSPVNVAAVTSSIDANISAGNIKDGVTILGVTGNYQGSGGGGGYKIGDRVTDDSNIAIGTIGAFYTDGMGNEYAVCVLDSNYRSSGAEWLTSPAAVTGMPTYDDLNGAVTGFYSESATENTQLILDYCSSSSNSSPACSFCRTKSFTIKGVTYYGQLPNLCELIQIYANHTYLGMMDMSEMFASSTVKLSTWFSDGMGNYFCWTSSQIDEHGDAWTVGANGDANYGTMGDLHAVCPVIELPNN